MLIEVIALYLFSETKTNKILLFTSNINNSNNNIC